MGRKPLVQARVDHDTKDAIELYADEHDRDLSQSEAVRNLIRAGLAERGYPVAAGVGGTPVERLASRRMVGLGGLLLAAAALALSAGLLAPTAALVATAVGTILGALALLTIWTATVAQLALGEPLRALVVNTEAA